MFTNNLKTKKSKCLFSLTLLISLTFLACNKPQKVQPLETLVLGSAKNVKQTGPDFILHPYLYQDEPNVLELELDLINPLFHRPRELEKGMDLLFWISINGNAPKLEPFTPDYSNKKAYYNLNVNWNLIQDNFTIKIWNQEYPNAPIYSAETWLGAGVNRRYNRHCKEFSQIKNQNDAIATAPFNLAAVGKNAQGWVNYLNLGNKNLSSLPTTIKCFKYLENLDLFSNQLTKIPDEIGKLIRLNRLNLWNNQIDQLPIVLNQLTELGILVLAGNRFYQLPHNFGENWKKLVYLDLNANRLQNLPESFWNMTALQELHLQENQLGVLSDKINQFSYLRVLQLAKNQIKSLPILSISGLKHLDLSYNQLTQLPERFDVMLLEKLFLNNNRLSTFDAGRGKVPVQNTIKELYLQDNQIKNLPTEFFTLQFLNKLDVRNNPFYYLHSSVRCQTYCLPVQNKQFEEKAALACFACESPHGGWSCGTPYLEPTEVCKTYYASAPTPNYWQNKVKTKYPFALTN